MWWVCFALVNLFCAPAYSPPDAIFWQGFEMYISTDRPASIVWSLASTPSNNASFITSSTYLSDNKVAVPTRIQWDSGTQTNLTYVTVIGTFSGLTIPNSLTLPDRSAVVAVLLPNTSYAPPVGAYMLALFDDGSNQISSNGSVVALNNGARAAIFIVENDTGASYSPTSLQVTFYNRLGAFGVTPWASAAQPFDIGEIYFGSMHQFKTATDPKIALLGGPTERRSHSNQPWPLMQKPYRQLQASLIPFTDSEAYSATNNFEQVRYALATAKSALVIPRIYTRGTTTVDQTAVNQQTIFGRPAVNAFGPMTGVKDATGYWTAALTVEEAPP